MKNYKSYIFLTLILTIGFLACTKEEKSEINENSNLEISNFEKVGLMHNNGLDFIFSSKTFNRIQEIGERAKNNRNNGIDTLAIAQIVFEETNNFIANNNTIDLEGNIIEIQPLNDLNEFMEIYRARELKVFSVPTDKQTAEEIKLDIDNIMKNYLDNTDADDYYKVMSTGSLYKHSVDYWSSEANRSADFSFLYTNSASRGWFSWVSFVRSDVMGAWGGAEIGAIGGPAGVIGGAVAFGLCSSALDAAVQSAIHAAQK